MTNEREPFDDDTEGLWDPSMADDEVRSLENRLLRHRRLPQAWSVPADVAQEPARDDPVGEDDPWTRKQPDRRAESVGDRSTEPADDERIPVWRAQGSRGARTLSFLAAAAIVLFFLGDTLGWFGLSGATTPDTEAPYVVRALEGLPEVQRRGVSRRGELLDVEAGDRLVCDDGARAELKVAHAGQVRMEPGTELRVDTAPEGGWRLYLERGQLTASIFAAPRLFQIGTPSGIAVDLGCVYTATVGEDGETILTVRGGQVSFEAAERKVFVPEGARVVAWPGQGPGTPVWEDAPGTLRKAVARLDELALTPAVDLDASGGRSAVDELARHADRRNSLTLWHLLEHPHPQVARAALENLITLSPPPRQVDPAAIRRGDPAALRLWREDLQTLW